MDEAIGSTVSILPRSTKPPLSVISNSKTVMKADLKKEKTEAQYRRYSDHPVVLKKLDEARKALKKADLTFLNVATSKSQ